MNLHPEAESICYPLPDFVFPGGGNQLRLPQSPPHSARIPVHAARPSARGSKGLCHKRIL